MRLDRFLCECGIGSRSEVKQYIKAGRIRTNGLPLRDPSAKVTPSEECISFDGHENSYSKFRYFMLNKPIGVVSATRDRLSDTVLELLKDEITRDLFPVGRLDKDTTGLLLLTNDGMLAHNLLSPKKHVEKTYLANVDTELSEEAMAYFELGPDIGDDKPALPAKIKKEAPFCYRVTLCEGRYHQVKRMFEACGSKVTGLKRISFGPLILDEALSEGSYRALTEEEIVTVQSLTSNKKSTF